MKKLYRELIMCIIKLSLSENYVEFTSLQTAKQEYPYE